MKATGLVAGAGSFLCVGAVCFGVWYMGFRDTWESDNSLRIKDLSNNAIALVELGKKDEANAVASQLRELVGDRSLETPELRSAYERACAAIPAPVIAVASPTPTATKPSIPTPPAPINKPITVSGGAWLTMKSGSSTELRGLQVFAVENNATNRETLPVLEHAFEKAELDQKECIEKVNEYKREQADGSQYVGEVLKSYENLVSRFGDELTELKKEIETAKARPDDPAHLLGLAMRYGIDAVAACPSRVIAKTYSNIDGKYTLESPRRDVFVFAHFSGTNTVTWIKAVPNEREFSFDLFNDSAWEIKNKD